jgi:hypothetical protein
MWESGREVGKSLIVRLKEFDESRIYLYSQFLERTGIDWLSILTCMRNQSLRGQAGPNHSFVFIISTGKSREKEGFCIWKEDTHYNSWRTEATQIHARSPTLHIQQWWTTTRQLLSAPESPAPRRRFAGHSNPSYFVFLPKRAVWIRLLTLSRHERLHSLSNNTWQINF